VLIAEELMLVATDDETGRRRLGTDRLNPALGGALLAELALLERIGITDPGAGLLARNKLTVTSDRPTDDDELDRALAVVVAKEGTAPQRLISSTSWQPITKELRQRLLVRLVDRGVLTRETGTVLRIFPTTRWPTYDPGPERAVVTRLRSTLVDGLTPDDRTRTLVGLLWVTGLLAKVVPAGANGPDRGTIRRRAKELAAGDWAVVAVKKAIDEASAASGAVG
jgi:hypothetical protein